jgi:toxin YoeB
MRITFVDGAWADYLYWQQNDQKLLQRLNVLVKECQRTPFSGIGKPEPLKGSMSGWWSRRISQEHRLVYRVQGDDLVIGQCRFHY